MKRKRLVKNLMILTKKSKILEEWLPKICLKRMRGIKFK